MIHCHQQTIPITDILTAVGTVGAVLVAIFWPIIQNLFYKPRLKIGFNFSTPDCHLTAAKVGESMVNAFYIRFYLQNEGRTTAKELEVTMNKIERKIKYEWQLCSDFLPSNLVWTNLGGPTLNNLLPKSRRNVDLAFIYKPLISERMINETELIVCISTHIFDKFHKFYPGEYKFSIAAGGSNCRPVEKAFLLSFTKDWQNEDDLFKSMEFKML